MIKKNIVLEKMAKGEVALGGWVMSNSVVAAEIMAQAGFSWVCVDGEHSQAGKETTVNMFRAIECHGAEPFVRISHNDEVEIKKYLDMGARGIIVPMIKSHQEVKQAISAIKYAPEGSRSFALPRCTGYGEWSDEYYRKANQETMIIIMIEHIDALQDLDEIFSCKDIHAILVGPYDLSGSMNIPGDFENPVFIDALELIRQKAANHCIMMGYHEVHPTAGKINALIKNGVKFIACGMDTIFLLEQSRLFSSLTDL